MDKLKIVTTTTYNLINEADGEVTRFIPTGFTDGYQRLFYVIEESPYNPLEPGNVVSVDVLDDKDIKAAFGITLPIKAGSISSTIKNLPNDKILGTELRDQQVQLEQNNPTFEFEKYNK